MYMRSRARVYVCGVLPVVRSLRRRSSLRVTVILDLRQRRAIDDERRIRIIGLNKLMDGRGGL